MKIRKNAFIYSFHNLCNTTSVFKIFYKSWGYEKYHIACLCINNIREITLSIPNFRLLFISTFFIYFMVIADLKCNLSLLSKQHKMLVYSVMTLPVKLHIRKLPSRLISGTVYDKQGCRCPGIISEQPVKVYHSFVFPRHKTNVSAIHYVSGKEAITFVLVTYNTRRYFYEQL